MSFKDGIISAPVNTDDVSMAIGCASHDVSTLCTYDNINPAAMFRPRYSPLNPALYLVDSDGKFSSAANTEIASKSNKPSQGTWACPACGIWVPVFALSNLTSSNYGTMHTQANYTWFVPIPDKSGTASFKILDHFIGYNANAKFKDPIIQASVVKKNNTTNSIQLQFSTPDPSSQRGVISVGNMFGTANGASKRWYFGAVVFRGTNADGITQNDTMIIFGSNTPIINHGSTTVTINKDDTPPNASSTTYYYRIIPFVCDRANVTSAVDVTFYSIHMSKDYEGIYTMKVGDSVIGGGIKTYYFAWREPYDRTYPMPDNTVVNITPSNYNPTIVATFKGRPDGITTPFKDLCSIVEFTFSVFKNGNHELHTYIWRKSGPLPDDNVLTRETSKDNIGSFEDYLFFSVSGAESMLNGVADLSEIELTADFYYENGQHDYGLLAVFVPDDYTEV